MPARPLLEAAHGAPFRAILIDTWAQSAGVPYGRFRSWVLEEMWPIRSQYIPVLHTELIYKFSIQKW
jgi:hypothetical protein